MHGGNRVSSDQRRRAYHKTSVESPTSKRLGLPVGSSQKRLQRTPRLCCGAYVLEFIFVGAEVDLVCVGSNKGLKFVDEVLVLVKELGHLYATRRCAQ